MGSQPVKKIKPVDIPFKNTIRKRWQLKQNKVPFNLENYTIKIAIKLDIDDSTYKLNPIGCDIDDEVNGKFSYEFTTPLTEEIFEGIFEFKLINPSLKERTLAEGRFVVSKTLMT